MYNYQETVSRIEDLDYIEMVKSIQSEISMAERNAYSGKAGCVKHREMGAPQYASRLKALAFYLGNFVMPGSADEGDIAIYRRITEILIKKKQLKPEALNIFKK